MTLADGLVAAGVLMAFLYVMVMRIRIKYPQLIDPLKEFSPFTDSDSIKVVKDKREQIWNEKRTIM